MTQPESPSPAGTDITAPASSPVQQVQGRDIMGKYAVNGSAPTSGNPDEPKPAVGEMIVDWGGVQRRVKVQDLVATARNAEQLMAQAQALSEAAKQTVVHNEAVKGFAQRVEQLTPSQREKLQQFFQTPDAFVPAPKQPAPEDDPFLAAPAQRPTLDPVIQKRIDDIEEGFKTMAGFLTQIGTERQAQTLSQSVDRLMSELPVFQASPEPLVRMARNAILTQLARDPKAPIEQLVQRAALEAQDVHTSYKPGLASPRGSPQNGGSEKPRYTGDDLLSGKVRRDAAEFYRQQSALR